MDVDSCLTFLFYQQLKSIVSLPLASIVFNGSHSNHVALEVKCYFALFSILFFFIHSFQKFDSDVS